MEKDTLTQSKNVIEKDTLTHCKNVIEVNDLTFSYKADLENKAVDHINLIVPKGQFIVIMGPSGAGKSTLANSLNGLIPGFLKGKYSGEVLINGKKVKGRQVSEMAKEIGLVFQDFEAQLFSTNVNLELAFGPENFQIEREEIVNRINHVIKTIKLEGFEKRQPATLSGGQKQRLAIGSVLATYPDIICMDEPTTDLDPIGKLGIFNIARELHESSQFTLLIVEHETEEALHADRLIIMKDGRILKDGNPDQILRDVSFTDEVGIMSLHIPSYFNRVLRINQENLPLDPEAGASMFQEKELVFSEEKYSEIIKREDDRDTSYGDTILTVKNLVYVYPNGNKAVDKISFSVREREFMAVLGHNGSGKTTLVKHFNALLAPTEGTVTIYGKNTREHSIFEIGKDIGYVFQNPDHQIFADTVFEEVAFSPKIRGVKDDEVKERVAEALKAVDLEGYEDEDPFCLRKGERQRVAVASILSARPKIII
ncbi:MAG: ATP-binding cassette domain-containing protein, partial [Spirochaetales bacterium]|nr:ATP-binding cassette domain-containing protein [Spirochaetales bacterium]